jgi:omega-amidase
MKIVTVSLNQVWEDKQFNLKLCERYISESSQKNVELIIFPEMTLTGFSTNIELTMEDLEKSETVNSFIKLAKSYNIAILFGMVIKDGEKALNQSIFINNQGELLGRYSKVHPFSFAGENKYFNAGNYLTIINFMNYKIGLTICYDLRFPELYSAYSKECDIVINIANWPKKRIDHWNTLLKARSIENQIFIIGVNRTGIDGNNLEYQESSNIFDANGDEVKFEAKENMKIYNISKEFTYEFKNKFNTTNDRKVELYKEII